MRWIFADPNNPEERAYKEHVVAATERWWHAFTAQAQTISRLFQRQANFDLPQFMEDHLSVIHSRLMWEFGPALHGNGHRLCITPESAFGLRPMLNYVLSQAPKLPGWEFYAHRLPEPVDRALASVEGRVGINIQGTRVAAKGAHGCKVDIFFEMSSINAPIEEKQHAAFVLAESLFGEETLDCWIGGIGLAEEEPKLRYMPLERAQETVSAVVSSFQEQLPQQLDYVTDESTNMTGYELHPEPAEEYPSRKDLFVGSSCRYNVMDAILRYKIFNSRCHTRFSERFCYLKIDARDVASDDLVEFRTRLQDPLGEALLQAKAGGVIGGGTGLEYSYIDLALFDVEQALPIIRQVLSSCKAPLCSWLEFDDTELECEWVGIYPETPPPPTESE